MQGSYGYYIYTWILFTFPDRVVLNVENIWTTRTAAVDYLIPGTCYCTPEYVRRAVPRRVLVANEYSEELVFVFIFIFSILRRMGKNNLSFHTSTYQILVVFGLNRLGTKNPAPCEYFWVLGAGTRVLPVA